MFYKLARLFFKLDKPKLKLTSLAVAHIARMRYIAILNAKCATLAMIKRGQNQLHR